MPGSYWLKYIGDILGRDLVFKNKESIYSLNVCAVLNGSTNIIYSNSMLLYVWHLTSGSWIEQQISNLWVMSSNLVGTTIYFYLRLKTLHFSL